MRHFKLIMNKNILDLSVLIWFSFAFISQFVFATYVTLFYGKATLTGNLENWNKVLPHGYVKGEGLGNFIVGIHLFLAIIIIIGGPLQLITKIRNNFPKFHRYNGRVFILSAYIISLAGLFMVWVRGSVGGLIQHLSISFNAILIIIAATFVIINARSRNIKQHKNWAIRLYLLVNGVWFFRVGLFFLLYINKGPAGYDPSTFQGPFLSFLSISQYAIPLILFELYKFTKRKEKLIWNYIMSIILLIFTVIIIIGTYAVGKDMWVPKMLE